MAPPLQCRDHSSRKTIFVMLVNVIYQKSLPLQKPWLFNAARVAAYKRDQYVFIIDLLSVKACEIA
jgi:hypothetical protein